LLLIQEQGAFQNLPLSILSPQFNLRASGGGTGDIVPTLIKYRQKTVLWYTSRTYRQQR